MAIQLHGPKTVDNEQVNLSFFFFESPDSDEISHGLTGGKEQNRAVIHGAQMELDRRKWRARHTNLSEEIAHARLPAFSEHGSRHRSRREQHTEEQHAKWKAANERTRKKTEKEIN
jgi:hypothetical protein